MSNYRLKVGDFIYPREVPVRIVTISAALIILIIVTILNIYIGLFFLVNIALLFFLLYQSSVSQMGYCVRVGPGQFPRIFNLARIAADRLDMEMPPVYIQQSPELNAYASGFWGNFYIIITSAMVEGYTDEELLPIIGHEFTHIKGNHVIITNITQTGVGLMKLVWWLQTILKYVFMYLSRCQEYTCDRGALIASGNIQAFVTAFTKIAVGPELFSKINMMEFYKQAVELDKNPLSILGEVESSHPYTVNRIRQAIRFYRSENYRRYAALQGKMGTSTLQGSLATGDLMQKIINKPGGGQIDNEQGSYRDSQYNQGFQGGNSQYTPPLSISQVGKPLGFCRKCGTPRKENAIFCSVCGTPYNLQAPAANAMEGNAMPIIRAQEAAASESNICPQCGERNDAQAVFCSECGYSFRAR